VGDCAGGKLVLQSNGLFIRLISHQTAVLFSQNKSAPAISHQPNE
jgi:hypothetical protein